MTNYHCYPSWRDYSGIIIEFSEDSYSWSPNNEHQRKYLAESNYCSNAKRVFVCNLRKWFSVEEFKQYCRDFKFEELSEKPKKTIEYTGEKCPICGGDLVFRKKWNGERFIGCGSYPECNYTQSIRDAK